MNKEEFLTGFECDKCGFICQDLNCPCGNHEIEDDNPGYEGCL